MSTINGKQKARRWPTEFNCVRIDSDTFIEVSSIHTNHKQWLQAQRTFPLSKSQEHAAYCHFALSNARDWVYYSVVHIDYTSAYVFPLEVIHLTSYHLPHVCMCVCEVLMLYTPRKFWWMAETVTWIKKRATGKIKRKRGRWTSTHARILFSRNHKIHILVVSKSTHYLNSWWTPLQMQAKQHLTHSIVMILFVCP